MAQIFVGSCMATQIIVIILIFCIFLFLINLGRTKPAKKRQAQIQVAPYNFFQILKNTYPNYHILKRNDAFMICEINHRNEPDELVIIRVNPKAPKQIRSLGRLLAVNYSRYPSVKEMQKDFQGHL